MATDGRAKTLSLMRYSPPLTRRMMVTRSSGLMSLRMNAAAPALMASNSWSSSSVTARAMIPALGTSRLTRCVVSMPPGRGQRQVEQDDVRRVQPGRVDGAAGVVRLGDDLEVRLRVEDLAHADPEERVVVDEQDLDALRGVAPVGTATPPLRSRVVTRSHRHPSPFTLAPPLEAGRTCAVASGRVEGERRPAHDRDRPTSARRTIRSMRCVQPGEPRGSPSDAEYRRCPSRSCLRRRRHSPRSMLNSQPVSIVPRRPSQPASHPAPSAAARAGSPRGTPGPRPRAGRPDSDRARRRRRARTCRSARPSARARRGPRPAGRSTARPSDVVSQIGWSEMTTAGIGSPRRARPPPPATSRATRSGPRGRVSGWRRPGPGGRAAGA